MSGNVEHAMCRIHGASGSLGVIWSSLTGN